MFAVVLFQVGAVIAGIGPHAVPFGLQVEDAADGVIQEGAVVRDDQRGAREAGQPAFQPFKHVDVKMICGFVEQQQVRLGEQETRQHQAGFLAPGEFANAFFGRQVGQTKHSQYINRLQIGAFQCLQGFIVGLQEILIGRAGSQGGGERDEICFECTGRSQGAGLGNANGRVELKALGQVADT